MLKIGISSGHNADNVNSSPDKSLMEWDINLKIKLKIKDRLLFNDFIFVDLNPNKFGYDLDDRADIANDNDVDANYAVHCNALEGYWGDWGGVESYAHPEAPEKGGKKLAKVTHKRLIQGTPLRDRGVKYADFAILRKTYAPAALGEMAFMDNLKESKLLITDQYQTECAIEIVQGICDFFNRKYKVYCHDVSTDNKYNQLNILYKNLIAEYEKLKIDYKNDKKVMDSVKKQLFYILKKYFGGVMKK